jgi:hypothetical protein
MLAGSKAAFFKCTFGSETTLALEVEFFALAAAKFTNRT